MEPSPRLHRIHLIRHGETEWSLGGRHTSRTDLPLTAAGEARASALGEFLDGLLEGRPLSLVLTSPMQRALRTCELAGLLDRAERTEDLREWDYGDYEGRTTPEIRVARPGWTIFHDGVPGGETAEDVAARVRRVIDRADKADGDVAIFGHGHSLRVLTAVWLRLAPEDGERFLLDAGAVSTLGYEHETRVVAGWNLAPTPRSSRPAT